MAAKPDRPIIRSRAIAAERSKGWASRPSLSPASANQSLDPITYASGYMAPVNRGRSGGTPCQWKKKRTAVFKTGDYPARSKRAARPQIPRGSQPPGKFAHATEGSVPEHHPALAASHARNRTSWLPPWSTTVCASSWKTTSNIFLPWPLAEPRNTTKVRKALSLPP